ncbi:MFS transporter [Bifidobacterium stellenboschense]|uniref:Macrolide-efflux protein, MFS member n=1 Tax=Bifidobacterium stellenboschense TaxID=762211 RepID=A0A087DPN3_9BIFI|nr:MFS transporter [Bifidobacterium stellenboschense]KFI97483.1 Macrolide-efflux protein, MFS member [Bifidobacterium stellenboschense]
MTNASEHTTQLQRGQVADPLHARDFYLLVAGLGISLFANLMLRFAMSMWVLDETGSAAAFASILTASILPTILLSPLGGVVADRTNRRTVMVMLDALSAVTVIACATVFSTIGFNLAAIAVMQVVLAVLDAMETPTVQAALPQMFRSHGEDVMRRAMAVVNVVNQTSTLVPAVLGGVLYAAVGAMPMMGVTVVGFGTAAVVECFIRLDAPERCDDGRASALDDLRAAGCFLTHERPYVLHLVLICAALNFLLTGYAEVGFPYMVRTVLGFGSTTYGLAYGLVGASGLLGALVGGRIAKSLAMRRFPTSIAAFALTILPQALVMALPAGDGVRLAVLTASTCGTMVAITCANLIAVPAIQMDCPETMTGKVMSLALSASMCAQPLGQIAYGWAYSAFPAGAVLAMTFVLAAAMLPLVARVTWRF